METTERILRITSDLTRKLLGKEDLGLDDDFFDFGASSLTIVDLQVQIESALSLWATTSTLMQAPSIRGWTDVYLALAAEPAAA